MRRTGILGAVNRSAMVLAAFWALLLAANITLDVLCRLIFNAPVLGTTEAITNSIVMIAFLQLPYAVHSRSMLRADFLLSVFPRRLSLTFALIGDCLGILLFAALVYGAVASLGVAWGRSEFVGSGTVRIPVWPIYAVIVAGALLATVNYVVHAIETVSGRGEL